MKYFSYCFALDLRSQKYEGVTYLVAQWLRLHDSTGGLGSIPDQETRYNVLQLRPKATTHINKKKNTGDSRDDG